MRIIEVKVVYLDSASEVGDVRDVLDPDVLPKVGEEFRRPWSSHPEKKIKTESRIQAESLLEAYCRMGTRTALVSHSMQLPCGKFLPKNHPSLYLAWYSIT